MGKAIGPITGGIKLGLEFFNHYGPLGVEAVREACPDAALFLDLKLHDIPNTVAGAVKTLSTNLAPDILNVHASGGKAMMEDALKACAPHTQLIAVTILTSLSDDDLGAIGCQPNTEAQVKTLAMLTQKLTRRRGLPAHDIAPLRTACGDNFMLMVPGIRPAGADQGDQKRIMTPQQAVSQGATHLVIGRPITRADDPAKTAADIMEALA